MTYNLPVKALEKFLVKIELKTPFSFSNRTSSPRSLLELRNWIEHTKNKHLQGAIFDFSLQQEY